MTAAELQARRAQLVAQCELDRIELALAWHDLRRTLGAGADPRRASPGHPWLPRALGLAIPLLGAARMRRVSRYLSLGLLAWRLVSGRR